MESAPMDSVPEDGFVVFVRTDGSHGAWPEGAERPLAMFPTYADALRLRRSLKRPASECVIRFVGPTGGGD
jgi:hypothetical protein